MLVDGTNFKVYELDSKESIRDRIAVKKRMLPKYIHFFSKFNSDGIENMETRLLSEEIKNQTVMDISDFYQECLELYTINIEEFANFWYIYNLDKGKRSDPHKEFLFAEFLEKHSINFEVFKSEVSEFQKINLSRFEKLKKQVNQRTEQFIEFEKFETVYSTVNETVRIKTELQFEADYDIYELFNALKMSRDIPFAVIGEYYKILKDFVPSEKWTYTRERQEGDFKDKQDVLFLKVLNLKNETLKNVQKTDPNLYSTITIFFESQQDEDKRKREERLKKEEKEKKDKQREEKKKKDELKKKELEKNTKIKRRKKKGEEEKQNNDIVDEEIVKFVVPEIDLPVEIIGEKIEEKKIGVINQINKVYMRIEGNVNPNLDEKSFVQRVLLSFPKAVDILSIRQIQIKSEFLVPDFHMDRPVFMDLILNNDIFSSICFVDERYRIQKEKGGIYLYFAFTPDDSEDKFVTCSITEQIVEKTSLKIIAKDKLLKPDTSYLRIRITKASDEIVAERFRNILMKLLSLYNKERDNVIEKYNEFIPNFEDYVDNLREEIEKKRKKSTRTNKMLKDVDPEQFISGYARSCQRPVQPRIVQEYVEGMEMPDEIKQLEDEGFQIMIFPKRAEEGKQFYYVCNKSKKDKYPGLKKNKLSNFEKFPLIPCCYKVDHTTKKKSLWREYYEDKDKTLANFTGSNNIEEEEDDEKHIYTTNKILPANRMGILAKDVDIYFKSINIHNKFLRQGVTRSYNSIIEVILLALDPNFDGYSKNEKMDLLREKRLDMLQTIAESNIFQEAYNYTPEMIAVYLADPQKYLDPKLFIRMLEEYFGCYLFIFTQNIQHPYGVLAAPYHVQAYLTLEKKPERETVFIYEHMGAELDRSMYPQCELIVQLGEKGDKDYSFKSKYEIVKRTNDIFKELYYSKSSDEKLTINFKSDIIGQGIDYYGKTRFLQFENICILTDPLPMLKIKRNFVYKPVKESHALEFLKVEKIVKYTSHIVSNKLIGLRAKKGNVKFYIPIKPKDSILKDSCDDCNAPSFIYKESEMDIYNHFHRTARYIVEYMLYLFSIDYLDEKPEIIDAEYIKKFVERNIEIDESFIYSYVPRTFSLESGVLRDRKLVVYNENVLKRLVYVLRLRLRNNLEEVKQYSKYKYIQQYYSDIKDFEQTDKQLILYGQHALMKWIENKKPIYQLYDTIQPSSLSLQNELMKSFTEEEVEGKLFVIIFTASWCKPCRSLMNRISDPRNISDKKKRERELLHKYGKDVSFIYIDIDSNKGIASMYNVSSLPYIYFMTIEEGKLIELDKIKGNDNVNESVKLIESKITYILNKD